MGRAKILMSHTRNIAMEMSAKFFRYTIPFNGEKENLGKLISAEIKGEDIIITYENIGTDLKKKAPEANFVIDFS
jgi:hypothetical protein